MATLASLDVSVRPSDMLCSLSLSVIVCKLAWKVRLFVNLPCNCNEEAGHCQHFFVDLCMFFWLDHGV